MARYKKSEEKTRQLLQAAFQAVAELGYDSVTLQTIADYAEVSKGVVHYYFDNKEAVLTALLAWLTTTIYEKELTAVEAAEGALPKLDAYLDAVFAGPDKNRKFYRVYLDFLSRASRNAAFREINSRFYAGCTSISKRIIEEGQHEGLFRTQVDAEQAAPALRAVIDGCLIQWLMSDSDELHAAYKQRCREAMVKMLA